MSTARPEIVPASLAVLPDHLPPFDLAAALVRVNGHAKLLRTLLLTFANTYGNAAADLRAQIAASSFDEAKGLVHAMRGVAGSLEARALFAAATELEGCCSRKNADEAAVVLVRVEVLLAEALAAIAKVAAMQAVSAAAMQAPRDIDKSATLALAVELGALLGRNSLSSRKRFRAFRELAEGGGCDAELDAMGSAIDTLDFAAARGVLETICTRLGEGRAA
jgi:HPt (histidine-containing phosphotransfer) domain-containing protein